VQVIEFFFDEVSNWRGLLTILADLAIGLTSDQCIFTLWVDNPVHLVCNRKQPAAKLCGRMGRWRSRRRKVVG
jgi:hypothetical protein